MKVSMKLFCSASNLWNRKIWNIEREPFAVCASPICTRETEQKLCSTRIWYLRQKIYDYMCLKEQNSLSIARIIFGRSATECTPT